MENDQNLVLVIAETKKKLVVKGSVLDGSTFEQVMMANAVLNDVALNGLKIKNANLSDLEIDGAQLGGAYIHNIGMPPEGHPLYNPNAKQRSLKFDNCNLEGSTINNCNLTDVEIEKCNITGMKINGVPVEELLKAYAKYTPAAD